MIGWCPNNNTDKKCPTGIHQEATCTLLSDTGGISIVLFSKAEPLLCRSFHSAKRRRDLQIPLDTHWVDTRYRIAVDERVVLAPLRLNHSFLRFHFALLL